MRLQQGDACELRPIADCRLPIADRRSSIAARGFYFVVSVFAAMFAPKPMEVAKEMVHVTNPGGRVVMGNWIPGDPTPPPPGAS